MSLFKHKDKQEKKNNSVEIIQENQEECINLIEQGFLKGQFSENVTDISYNGYQFYGQDNETGRFKINLNVSNQEVLEFVKKIANYMLQPFSTKSPSLDVAFGNYRLNAIHPSFGRNNTIKVITFSLRKITPKLKIKENDYVFAPEEVHRLLRYLMVSHQSILISGQTGSGKTEFQKYLVSLMDNKDRIIIIEDNYETHIKEIYPEMDITTWITKENDDEIGFLVKNALRNNPDWIIVAETRTLNAAYEMISAVMSGHSAITTIHSESAKYSLNRLSNLCKKGIDLDEKMFLSNVASHIKIGVHLEKKQDLISRKIIRRIVEIVEYIPTNNGFETNVLFEITKDENLKEKNVFRPISKNLRGIFIKNDLKVKELSKFYKQEKKNEKAKTK